jgi:hypothetical protein
LNNLSQIKFGITKVVCTFEVPKVSNGVEMLQTKFVGFFYAHKFSILYLKRWFIIHRTVKSVQSSVVGLLAGDLVATFSAILKCQKFNNK